MPDEPRLLADFSPLPGTLKEDYEDFEVDELPLYPAAGDGTHTYFLLEKRGLSTMQAVRDVATRLNVSPRAIGFAGMKDARAVTRQWMSVEHIDPAAVLELSIPRIRILEVTRHTNKLRLGHLSANRFRIRVRHTEPDRLAEVQDALATLARRGVPNYFGRQRFGGRGDTWRIGRAIVREDVDEAIDLMLGRPGEEDRGDILRARQHYEKGEFGRALRLWPGMFRDERRALRALEKTRGKRRRAFAAIDKAMRRFYVSSYQSYLFNRVVVHRLANRLERLECGDLAWLHESGAVFLVEDAAAEQPRADRFEISPTGPLFGYRMTDTRGQPGEFEQSLLQQEGLTRKSFQAGPLRVKGARRPLRFPPRDAQAKLGADERGVYLELHFALPSGCYATSLLRELFAERAGAEHEETEAT